ncbi:MAG: PAS domain-containing protein [Bryobacteraceae bacterium]
MPKMPLARHGSFAGLPIGRKLTLIIMGVTAAALLIAGLGLLAFDLLFFREYMQRDLAGLARIIADNSTAALTFDDPSAAQETLRALRTRPHVLAACIYGGDGSLFARYSHAAGNVSCPPPAPHEEVEVKPDSLALSHPIMLTGRRIGTVVLLSDLEELYQRTRLYAATVVAMLVLSGLFAFLLSARLQNLIAGPISQLARASADVSQTRDYGIRAQKVSRDEVGVLVDAFNDMLAGIQSRDSELREALTAREAALQVAREARDFLRTTLASIGDAVVSTDPDGNVVFANPVACALTGWPESDIAGHPLAEVLRLVNESTRAPVESPVAQVLREGTIIMMANSTVLVARGGAEIPIDDSAAPIRNDQGELIGVVLIFRDITERRRAEQELRAAREQLQIVTNTMSPAVTHCNRNLQYVWVSPSYAQWLHRRPADFSGKSIAEMLGPEAYEAIRPFAERVLSGERLEYESELELAHIGRRWTHAAYVPTHDPNGAVNGWVAHISDITELKKAQAEVVRVNADLQKTNERLARSNQDLERFAFAASHDLQEPLRMIATYAQLLVRTYPDRFDGDAAQFVRNIVESATRMRGLLADLLAYSEIGEDGDEPAGTVDLNDALETAKANLKVSIEETGALIVSDPLPVVSGRAGHFVQLFQNLVGNAIKYRSESAPRVRVSCERTGAEYRFGVADNGIGIDPEYHKQIFTIFKRLHGKKIPGTGIGLAICQRVVERHHGRIWVESQAGLGATFYFTLPTDIVKSQENANG